MVYCQERAVFCVHSPTYTHKTHTHNTHKTHTHNTHTHSNKHTGVAAGAALLADPPPTYQPSPLLPRNTTNTTTPTTATAATATTTSTAAKQAAAALEITVPRKTLEVWIDRLRQWFAASLLQPLVDKIDTAHNDVQQAAAALSWTVEPGPLAGGRGAGGVGGSGGMGGVDVQRRQGDDEVLGCLGLCVFV